VKQPVLIVALVVFGGAAAHAQRPDLSGHWVFNQTQSDNPRDMMQGRDSGGGGRMPGGRGGFGGGFGGRGGRMGGGGGRGGRWGGQGGGPGGMSDEERARMRQTMDLVFTAPASLVIAGRDSSITFVTDADTLVLSTDGRKVKRKASVEGEGDVDINGRWQGNDFIVERSVSGGGKVSEDYLRSSDGKQLYVIVSFEGGRGRTITFRRVYDPSE
jgi:hypothetical protein